MSGELEKRRREFCSEIQSEICYDALSEWDGGKVMAIPSDRRNTFNKWILLKSSRATLSNIHLVSIEHINPGSFMIMTFYLEIYVECCKLY